MHEYNGTHEERVIPSQNNYTNQTLYQQQQNCKKSGTLQLISKKNNNNEIFFLEKNDRIEYSYGNWHFKKWSSKFFFSDFFIS